MKVAFLNRGRVHPGGDLIALDATVEALRRLGVECVETGWDRQAMASGGFDLAHIFHCDFDWSKGNYEAVQAVGLPYVLTPIYYGFYGTHAAPILDNAKAILPFSQLEAGELPCGNRKRITVIPNGTDKEFFYWHDSVDGRVRRVLCVSARGKSDKNAEVVERICKRNGYKFVCATDLTREDLATYYKASSVFVNASPSERMSLTIGEALCAGCRVLATKHNWGNEWYPGLVTFDPTDEIKLEHLIRWAINSASWDYRPNEAARQLTWDWVASKIKAVYEEVLCSK